MNKLAKAEDGRTMKVQKCSACGDDHIVTVSDLNHFLCPKTGVHVYFRYLK